MFDSYESWGFSSVRDSAVRRAVNEAYDPNDLIQWQTDMINIMAEMWKKYAPDAKESNPIYYQRLSDILDTWQNTRINGSVNRETIEKLRDAVKPWGRVTEDWPHRAFMASLDARLQAIIADLEKLPMPMGEPDASMSEEPKAPVSDFGPEKNAPRGEEAVKALTPTTPATNEVPS